MVNFSMIFCATNGLVIEGTLFKSISKLTKTSPDGVMEN